MENFELNSDNLFSVLSDIISQHPEDECFREGFFRITQEIEEEEGEIFNISFVPPGTKHPLQNTVTKIENGFFIVGKAVVEGFQDEEGEEMFECVHSKLFCRETKRVLVGTPISQEIRYINGSEPLHKATTKTDTTTSRGIIRVENTASEFHIANLSAVQVVSSDQARYITSLFDFAIANNQNSNEHIKCIPLWFLVEAENGHSSMNLTHLASFPKPKSINHVIVTNRGPFENPATLPKMSYFKKWHLGQHLGHIETSGHATFELLGLPQMLGDLQDQQQSWVYVEFAWEGVAEVLQPPPLACNSVLHVQNIPGSMELTAQELNQEVSKLSDLSELLEGTERSWPFEVEIESKESASQKTEKLLEKMNSDEGLYTPGPDKECEESKFLPIEQDAFMTRKDLDFTESLWTVLKDAHGFNDLIAGLEVALFAIFTGSNQPMLYGSSHSTIASLVREVLTSETVDQKQKIRIQIKEILSQEESLKCLVEIGTEKLMRDLTNFFLSEELVTQEQLDYYVDFNAELPERVHRVRKLHNILDLILTTKSVIDVGHSNLQLLSQSGLVYYKNHDADEHPVFSLSLPTFGTSSGSAVKSIILNQKPSIWCASLKSKLKKEELVSVVQLSTMSMTSKLADLLAGEMSMANVEGDVTLNDLPRCKMPYYLTCAKQTLVPIVPSKHNNNS